MKNEYTFQCWFRCEASSLNFSSANEVTQKFEEQIAGLHIQSVQEINTVTSPEYLVEGIYTVTVKAPNLPSGWVAAAGCWTAENFSDMIHPYRGDFILISQKEITPNLEKAER